MNVKNIILLVINPIGQRDFDRFGIGYFISKNKNIIVLNIRELLYKNMPITYSIEKKIDSFNYIEISTLVELDKELQEYSESDSVIFTFFGFHVNSFKVYKLLSKHNIKFGAFYIGVIPELFYYAKETLAEKILRLKNTYRFNVLCKKVINQIYNKIILKISNIEKKIRKYDFVVIAGKMADNIKQNTSFNTKIIKAHALDFDFLIQDDNLYLSSDYIVYLDEFIPYHDDNQLVGMNIRDIANIYYYKMNTFLNYLSKRYGKEVIICAHPRSQYDKYKVWGDKKVVLFETYSYVKQAFVCITHASTSTNFAVMLNKPINFVYFKEIEFYKLPILAVSDSLGKKPIDLDIYNKELNKIDFTSIDQIKYKKYIENYITEDIEDRRCFWKIVSSELNEL